MASPGPRSATSFLLLGLGAGVGNAESGSRPHKGLSAPPWVRRAWAPLVQPVLGPAAGGTLTASSTPPRSLGTPALNPSHSPVPSDLL